MCAMAPRKKVTAVLRVTAGERYLGDILLDKKGRVWRKATTIPSDVVLKALVAFTRGASKRGEVTGLKDGGTYTWFLLGSEVERINEAA
jgi:hypothetical protein